MTALVFCSQIMSQKWPHVFLRGPCGQQRHVKHTNVRWPQEQKPCGESDATGKNPGDAERLLGASRRGLTGIFLNNPLPESICNFSELPPWRSGWRWCSRCPCSSAWPDCDRLQGGKRTIITIIWWRWRGKARARVHLHGLTSLYLFLLRFSGYFATL